MVRGAERLQWRGSRGDNVCQVLTACSQVDGDGMARLVEGVGDLHVSECGEGRGCDGGPIRGECCMGSEPGC